MLRRVKTWIAGREERAPAAAGLELRRRAAALLVEAAHLDGHYGPEEKARIRAILAARFGLTAKEAEALAASGEHAQAVAVDLFRFTRGAPMDLSEAERIGLIEMLWEVVYADGREHPYESSLMRRVTGLLHLSDRQSAEARQRVLEQLGRIETTKAGTKPGA